jgi:preprotein translocase subunit YajC
MSFFISDAYAQAAPAAQQPDLFSAMLPFVIIIVLFYFLLIRPQQKRAKEHKKMVEALAKGDEVLTSGGVLGKVTEVGEQYIDVEVAEGVVVKVQRQSVGSVLPKGTLKSAS